MRDVVVVGAGLAGLACAWDLRRRGRDVLVLEHGSEPGGVVQSRRIDGFLVEAGPNTILPTPELTALIREAGLDQELVTAPPKLARFVVVGGRLRRVPWVLSVGGLARAIAEPFVRRRSSTEDESVADFFIRRFGRELHDRLAAPFVSGIYAGDTVGLGMESTFPGVAALERDYGSVLIGYLRSPRKPSRSGLCSFREGMATLTRGLALGMDLRVGVADTRVNRVGNGVWRVNAGALDVQTRSVVLAVPAYAVSACLPEERPLGELCGEVSYAPLVVAAAALGTDQVSSFPNGFGFLVPRTEGFRILGTLFSSTLFPGRAPAGKLLLTTFIGGAMDTESPGWPEARIWTTVEAELKRVLGFDGSLHPVALFRYVKGIPQYRIGHRVWLGRVRERLGRRPGLFLTGNYLEGVSVPATVENGLGTGSAVTRYLEMQA